MNASATCWWRRESAGALKSFRDGLAIRDRLEGRPGNAAARDLSCLTKRLGDVLERRAIC